MRDLRIKGGNAGGGRARRSLGRGVLQALVLPILFAAGGVGGQALLPAGAPAAYPAEMVPGAAPPQLWLVDGFNVVSVGLLRGQARTAWWRSPQRRALLERAEAFEDREAEIWVVFDGQDPGGDRRDGRTRTVFAASADAWLLSRVRSAECPAEVTVVTADRSLASKVRAHGAQVVAPAAFLDRCTG